MRKGEESRGSKGVRRVEYSERTGREGKVDRRMMK
jgi:hypothetical protein